MIQVRLKIALKLRYYLLGKRFSKLNAPLIKRVNLPEDTLCKNTVLIQGDKLAQNRWSEPFGKDHAGWPVPFKNLVRGQPVRDSIRLYFFECFTKSQCLSLGYDICQQHFVMPPQGIE